jgi:cytoskeletal protein CcmA (bactofilin family)
MIRTDSDLVEGYHSPTHLRRSGKVSYKFTINGRTFSGNVGSVAIVNGRIFVDGKEVDSEGEALSGVVEVRILEGTIQNLKSDVSITVEKGDVLGNVDARMSVTVHGNVQGDVDAGQSVTIRGNVGGDVDAGQSVSCGDVKGNVDAGMSVKRR